MPMQVSEQLKRAIVEACGRVVEIDGWGLLLFPTPEVVRDATPAVRDAIDPERKKHSSQQQRRSLTRP
jgi:hypothetical protein